MQGLWRPSSVVDALFGPYHDDHDEAVPTDAADFQINVDQPMRARTGQTAVYVFCDMPTSSVGYPVRHWGFVRKLEDGARARFVAGGNPGAAGTPPQYWGKWTNVGGGVDTKLFVPGPGGRLHSLFDAALSEINHEAAIPLANPLTREQISINLPNKTATVTNPRAELVFAEGKQMRGRTLGIFALKWADPADFVSIFPQWPTHRRDPIIVQASGGECDAICSMTQNQMEDLQQQEHFRAEHPNNFFTQYALQTLYEDVLPSPNISTSGNVHPTPDIHDDSAKGGRKPWEFPGTTGNPASRAMYREAPVGVYTWA